MEQPFIESKPSDDGIGDVANKCGTLAPLLLAASPLLLPVLRCELPPTPRCTRCCKRTFPWTRWLPGYSFKNDLVKDVVAGLTVGVMAVPQAMSYATVAGTRRSGRCRCAPRVVFASSHAPRRARRPAPGLRPVQRLRRAAPLPLLRHLPPPD